MKAYNLILPALMTFFLFAAASAPSLLAAEALTPENCGAMYVWGVDTQWEPYNAKAREAQCAKYGLSPAPAAPAVQTKDCGKMYVWGREVQDQPYNQKAREALCAKGW